MPQYPFQELEFGREAFRGLVFENESSQTTSSFLDSSGISLMDVTGSQPDHLLSVPARWLAT